MLKPTMLKPALTGFDLLLVSPKLKIDKKQTWFIDLQYYQPSTPDYIYPKEMAVAHFNESYIPTWFVCKSSFKLANTQEVKTI